MHRITRRDTLKAIAVAIAAPALARPASAAPAPLPPLPTLPTTDAVLLKPGQAGFDQYKLAFNRRTLSRPKLLALCKTPNGVASLVKWSRDNDLPFALRSGGHSYEGFSQSPGVAIDTREMKQILPDKANQTMTVGAGAPLGQIYQTISKAGFAFPGGSCPTVGITGLTTGGGFGFLGRRYGLACDSLLWAELVDARGKLIEADAQQNPDLFWALRGGGGGSFGAITRMRFKIYPVTRVVDIRAAWSLPLASAVKLMLAWQAWAPQAPETITTVIGIGRRRDGNVSLHCRGLSTGTPDEARRELTNLTRVAPTTPQITPRSFIDAMDKGPYSSVRLKAKSDYVATPLSEAGMTTLLREILKTPGPNMRGVGAICDAYGGAVSSLADDATAFAHRKMLYSIQYTIDWGDGVDAKPFVARINQLHAAMRPHVSGAAYVNYPDGDLPDYQTAYWGGNLPRLRQIKSAFDPDNVFRHAQSVKPA
jgi:FAD/FMN-containing dehydrogenase